MAALEARADIDPLTELPNRRGFERELERSLAYVKRHGTSAALLYLDLDGFKRVNDRHGHAAGDAVLRAVAMVLAATCATPTWWRGSAATSSRCCCGTATRRMRSAKARGAGGGDRAHHRDPCGRGASVGASVGAAHAAAARRPADVLERADRAMYARKAARGSAGRRQLTDAAATITADLPPPAQCATFAATPRDATIGRPSAVPSDGGVKC